MRTTHLTSLSTIGILGFMCSCNIFETGRTYYTALDYGAMMHVAPDTASEARSCLDAANDEADRAGGNRKLDLAFIYLASLFSIGGLGTTTASTFISDTHDGGKPSDLRQTTAAVGAISVGVGAGLLALRTALNLGELANVQVASSAAQANLVPQIIDNDKSPTAREALYAKCTQLTTNTTAPYPLDNKSNAPPTTPSSSASTGAAPPATPPAVTTGAGIR